MKKIKIICSIIGIIIIATTVNTYANTTGLKEIFKPSSSNPLAQDNEAVIEGNRLNNVDFNTLKEQFMNTDFNKLKTRLITINPEEIKNQIRNINDTGEEVN